MPSPYNVTITNGTGTAAILNGTYTVSANFVGYNDLSILPTSETITAGIDSYNFTIAATGTLTLHVTEDGTAGGVPVVGAQFVRADSAGNVYGATITTDINGAAVFPFVPFAATGAPLIYYFQTASDGNHEFNPSLLNTSMTTSTQTVQVTNTPAVVRTLNLTDLNYAGLPIASGTLTLA